MHPRPSPTTFDCSQARRWSRARHAPQLRNDGEAVAEVLCIVSPAFVFETDDGRPILRCIARGRTWEELSAMSDDIPAMRATPYEAHASREESMRRLAVEKGRVPAPLADQGSFR